MFSARTGYGLQKANHATVSDNGRPLLLLCYVCEVCHSLYYGFYHHDPINNKEEDNNLHSLLLCDTFKLILVTTELKQKTKQNSHASVLNVCVRNIVYFIAAWSGSQCTRGFFFFF